MKVLIIGSGGREHALAWKMAKSDSVNEILVAPGNGGTATLHKARNIAIADSDLDGLLECARSNAVDLTVVGPEAPLVAGIVDRFTAAGLRCFGPSAAAAQLEGSKAYAKAFMQRHSIPTASYAGFRDLKPALEYLQQQRFPQVIKASGLAAGKGVIIAEDLAQAEQAVRGMLNEQQFGSAGDAVVIEDFLHGEEVSFIVVAAGSQFVEFATSQDHKRALDGDQGLNTGGMGAYSPAPVVDASIRQRIIDQVIEPTLAGLQADGIDYTGFLYAGLMLDADGQPKVLEYNCRLGDPETQPLLMRLDSDLPALLNAALDQQLDQYDIQWSAEPAMGVVIAAQGYPGSYAKGMSISGQLDDSDKLAVFHAGTRIQDDQLISSGGRIVCVTAKADNLQAARDRVYARVAEINIEQPAAEAISVIVR